MIRSALPEAPSAQYFRDQLTPSAEAFPFAGGSVALVSLRQPGKETPSEDCAALFGGGDNSGVLAIADGAGGMPSGELASQLAIDQLCLAIDEAVRDGQTLRAGILDGFERANQAVLELGVGAATTLAVVEVQGSTIRPYHVGDSIVMISGQRGKLKLLTVAHSPVGYAVEAGFLDQIEAMYHAERHLVSNLLGTAGMHITIGSSIELDPRDTLLLASDGLADNLHLSEIIQRMRKGPIDQAAALLANDGLQRMLSPAEGEPSKPDDLTAIVYRRGI